MANDSRKSLDTQLLSESERSAFYAWAHAQGFTRLNASFEQLGEELWRDAKGKIVSAGRIVDEHPTGGSHLENRRLNPAENPRFHLLLP